MTLNPIQNKIREMALEQARAAGTEAPASKPVAAGGFDELLGQLVSDVDSLQKTAGSTIHELVAEEGDGAVQDMAKKMREADAAYDLMMQIRHKLVDVYSAVEKKTET